MNGATPSHPLERSAGVSLERERFWGLVGATLLGAILTALGGVILFVRIVAITR